MFKVGDWVIRGNDQGIDSNGKNANRLIFKITKFGILDDEELAVFNRHSAPLNELNKWQPKVGEWCWFYNEIPNKPPILGKFIGMFMSSTYKCHWRGIVDSFTIYEHCEPFIGELPSFLQH